MLTAVVAILAITAVATLGWRAKKVSDHDANDRELLTRVSALGTSMTEVKSTVCRMDGKLDMLVGRQAALN